MFSASGKAKEYAESYFITVRDKRNGTGKEYVTAVYWLVQRDNTKGIQHIWKTNIGEMEIRNSLRFHCVLTII
jgi:hypothetical protein